MNKIYRGKKYLICPGHIISGTDGDKHYISASQLMALYKVDREDCIIYDIDQHKGYQMGEFANLIVLRPRGDGDYRNEGCYSYVKGGELYDCTCGKCF